MAVTLPPLPPRLGALNSGVIEDWAEATQRMADALETKFQSLHDVSAVSPEIWSGTAGDSVRAVRSELRAAAKPCDNLLRDARRGLHSAGDELADIQTTRARIDRRYARLTAQAKALDPAVDPAEAAALRADAEAAVRQAEQCNADAGAVLTRVTAQIGEVTTALRAAASRLAATGDQITGVAPRSGLSALDGPARRQAAALATLARSPSSAPWSGLLGGLGLRELIATTPSDQTMVNFGQDFPITSSMVSEFRRLMEGWDSLPVSQRVGGLGVIINATLTSLGMTPVSIKYSNLQPDVLGAYSSSTRMIAFSSALVSGARPSVSGEVELFAVLVHEASHAVQDWRLTQMGASETPGQVPAQAWAIDPQTNELSQQQWLQHYDPREREAMTHAVPHETGLKAAQTYYCSPMEWEAFHEDATASSLYLLLAHNYVPSDKKLAAFLPQLGCDANPVLPSVSQAAP